MGRNYGVEPKTLHLYDHIDLRDSYRAGFTIGAVSGVIGMFILCLACGIYLIH